MLEWDSEPRFLLPDGEEDAHFSDASTYIRVIQVYTHTHACMHA